MVWPGWGPRTFARPAGLAAVRSSLSAAAPNIGAIITRVRRLRQVLRHHRIIGFSPDCGGRPWRSSILPRPWSGTRQSLYQLPGTAAARLLSERGFAAGTDEAALLAFSR